jgi:hypothetical protein
MRGDRFLFTAFAIGALGPRRAAKAILIGVAGGLLFGIVMGSAISLNSTEPPAVQRAITQEQIIQQWPADKQNRTYLRSIGLCNGYENIPQCN